MDDRRPPFGSRREAEDKPKAVEEPVPVLHVGEVHANLVLHVTDDTLSSLAGQIGAILARAAYDGFVDGMTAALHDVDSERPVGPPEFASASAMTSRMATPAAARPDLTDADLARVRGD